MIREKILSIKIYYVLIGNSKIYSIQKPNLLYLNKEERHTRTQFRISSHRLEVERGHYFGLKFESRICKLCNGHVEDEEHFMISCKKT
jgi:hypothetical protein